jgi:hypothetical protein
MSKLALFLVAILSTLSAVVQSTIAPLTNPSILLVRAIPTESGTEDIAFGLLPLADGALITGSTAVSSNPSDGLVVRINNDGDVLWRKTFGRKGPDIIFSIVSDGDGYICAGLSGGEANNLQSLDGWILRLDAQGNSVWQKTYGAPLEDRLTEIQPAKDGWMAVGQTDVGGTNGIQSWVLHIDRLGNQIASWNDGDANIDRAFTIQPLDDGGCLIGGMSGKKEPKSYDGFVMRLAADGHRVWNHPIAGDGLQVVHDIRRFADSSFFVVGYGYVNAAQYMDGFVLQIKEDGKEIFHRTFGGPTYDRVNHSQIFANGSSVVIGYTQRPGAKDEETGWDLVLYSLDAKGNPVWSARFGGEGYEFGRSVAGTADNLWAVGHTSTGRNGSSLFVIRLDVR